jgi:hypothetical protein
VFRSRCIAPSMRRAISSSGSWSSSFCLLMRGKVA